MDLPTRRDFLLNLFFFRGSFGPKNDAKQSFEGLNSDRVRVDLFRKFDNPSSIFLRNSRSCVLVCFFGNKEMFFFVLFDQKNIFCYFLKRIRASSVEKNRIAVEVGI